MRLGRHPGAVGAEIGPVLVGQPGPVALWSEGGVPREEDGPLGTGELREVAVLLERGPVEQDEAEVEAGEKAPVDSRGDFRLIADAQGEAVTDELLFGGGEGCVFPCNALKGGECPIAEVLLEDHQSSKR